MDSSPLSKLPPELRKRIYKQVLKCDGALQIFRRSSLEGIHATLMCELSTFSEGPTPGERLALTKTCRELREVCAPIFYKINRFRFQPPTSGRPPSHAVHYALSALDTFCRQIGPRNVAALRLCHVDAGQVEADEREKRSLWYSELRHITQMLLDAVQKPENHCPPLLLNVVLCYFEYAKSDRFKEDGMTDVIFVFIEIDATALQASFDAARTQIDALVKESKSPSHTKRMRHLKVMKKRVRDCVRHFCGSGYGVARAEPVTP